MSKLSLRAIKTNGGTQPREALNEEAVSDYAEKMTRGEKFPPVVVFFDGADRWLADGFHRVEAARRAGRTEIDADIRQGDKRAAVLHSVGANREHGLPRTNADKRRAVLVLLDDAEWSQWSDREIARVVGVSQPFVGTLRPAPSDNGCQTDPAPRKFNRGGKTHTQKPRTKATTKQATEPASTTPAARPVKPEGEPAKAPSAQGHAAVDDPGTPATSDGGAGVVALPPTVPEHLYDRARNMMQEINSLRARWVSEAGHDGFALQALSAASASLAQIVMSRKEAA